MHPDTRLRRVHYDWLEAGEHTQRTVARLSAQLRRFLDDQAWLENRRIMDILRGIEAQALELREQRMPRDFMPLAGMSADVGLPMERPLYRVPVTPLIQGIALDEGDADVDTAALYAQIVVDRSVLSGNIRRELEVHGRASLGEVIERHPLRHGLAEIVVYLQLAAEWSAEVDEAGREQVKWQTDEGVMRRATLPRILFERN
jgi:hypothetical protein